MYRYCGNDPVNLLDPDGEDWVDFVPFIGSGRDLWEGIREGDWGKIALGAGGLLLDLSTGGGGAIVKGIVNGGVKNALRQGAKKAAANGVQSITQQGSTVVSRQSRTAVRKQKHTGKQDHHVMTNKNRKAPPRWTIQFEHLLRRCNAAHYLDDTVNIVELPAKYHNTRHGQGYHRLVYQANKRIVDEYDYDPEKCRKELDRMLRWLKRYIKRHPNILKKK